MKINKISCNNYSTNPNFRGKLKIRGLGGAITEINTDDIRCIKQDTEYPGYIAISTNKNKNINISAKYNLSDVLAAYTAACQNEDIVVDISKL